MTKDLSTNQLIDALVERLRIEYGSIEIKVHDGKWTNYLKVERINKNESGSRDFLEDKVKND